MLGKPLRRDWAAIGSNWFFAMTVWRGHKFCPSDDGASV